MQDMWIIFTRNQKVLYRQVTTCSSHSSLASQACNMSCTSFSFLAIFICLLTLPEIIIPAPLHFDDTLLEFMKTYGFVRPQGYVYDSDTYREGIRRMQSFYNIPVSGYEDQATLSLLTQTRCGSPDLDQDSNSVAGRRQRRFVEHGAKWQDLNLKYYIKSRTSDLPKGEVDKGVETALEKWSSVSLLTFQKVKSEAEADITFLWATRSHGDVNPFDGPGGSLAHAFYPDAGGDVHVDDDENWSIEIDNTKHNLVQVVTHEVGHSLGLRHSPDRDSMMYAYISRHSVKLDLNADDIQGIQKLYGFNRQAAAVPTTNSPTTTYEKPDPTKQPTRKSTYNPFQRVAKVDTTETSITTRQAPKRSSTYNPFHQRTSNPFLSKRSANAAFCDQLDKIDAAVKIDESVYLFWREYYFKTNTSLEKGYPRLISDDWNPLPDHLDAALYWPEEGYKSAKYMFFKGSQVWFFNKYRQYVGEVSINSYFGGSLPNDIDSAFVRPGKSGSYSYFTKGTAYYVTKTHDPAGIKGPYPTSLWGWPSGLNAAFTFDPIATYFFLGNEYYASDILDDNMQVDFRFYPRPVTQWWLSCY